jgi:hypothetical protein
MIRELVTNIGQLVTKTAPDAHGAERLGLLTGAAVLIEAGRVSWVG